METACAGALSLVASAVSAGSGEAARPEPRASRGTPSPRCFSEFEHEAGVDERREAVVPADDVRSLVRGTLGTREGGADPREQLHGAVRRRALPRRVQKPVPVCHRRAQSCSLAPGG